MTQHDPLVSMRHMRDHAGEAITLLTGKSLEDLRADRVLQLALVQLIELAKLPTASPVIFGTSIPTFRGG